MASSGSSRSSARVRPAPLRSPAAQHRVDLDLQLRRLLGEDAERRAAGAGLEHLGQQPPGGFRVSQRHVRAGELEPRLHRQPGQRFGQLWCQAERGGQVGASLVPVAAAQRGACGGGQLERGRRVAVEPVASASSRARSACSSAATCSPRADASSERSLIATMSVSVAFSRSADSSAAARIASASASCPRSTSVQPSRSSAVGRHGLDGRQSGERGLDVRRTSARRRRGRARRAGARWPARPRLRRRGRARLRARRRRASARPRPVARGARAASLPSTATAGYRSSCASRRTCSSQLFHVVDPAAVVRRAARSRPRSAPSGRCRRILRRGASATSRSPWASNQSAARRWSVGDERGLGLAQLSRKQITEAADGSGTPRRAGRAGRASRWRRSSEARTRPESFASSTASQTGAVRRSSTDVRRRNVRSSSVSGERNSERKYSARNRSSPPGRAWSSPPASSRAASALEADTRRPALTPLEQLGGIVVRETRVEARRSASLSRRLSARSAAAARAASRPRADARSAATGRGVPTSASVDPAGTCSASVASTFVALRERSSCASSTTSTKSSERAQSGREPLQLGRPILRPASGRDGRRIVGADALERLREPGEQDGRVVVGLVDGEPGDRAGVRARPTAPRASSCRIRPGRRA